MICSAAWIASLSPLAAALADHARGQRASRAAAPGYVATAPCCGAFAAAVVVVRGMLGREPRGRRSGLDRVDVALGRRTSAPASTILVDPLSVI